MSSIRDKLTVQRSIENRMKANLRKEHTIPSDGKCFLAYTWSNFYQIFRWGSVHFFLIFRTFNKKKKLRKKRPYLANK